MRSTADAQHGYHELMGALEGVRDAVLSLAVVTLMQQDRSREAAIAQVKEIDSWWAAMYGD